jgi:riboflavin synthase
MFTGIVKGMATVVDTRKVKGRTYSMSVELGRRIKNVRIGDSIALNGVCLTLVGKKRAVGRFDVMSETLSRTNLGTLKPGSKLNVEESMSIKDKISGHFVTGHVDGVGRVQRVEPLKDGSVRMVISADRKLTSMMVEKGSVSLDGVSLTLVEVQRQQFAVCLIPHTLKVTTLGIKKQSDLVNIEIDYIGKYVLKLVKNYGK